MLLLTLVSFNFDFYLFFGHFFRVIHRSPFLMHLTYYYILNYETIMYTYIRHSQIASIPLCVKCNNNNNCKQFPMMLYSMLSMTLDSFRVRWHTNTHTIHTDALSIIGLAVFLFGIYMSKICVCLVNERKQ